MAFDLAKALEKVPADKRAALEAALKESQGFIEVIETQSAELENERTARKAWEAEKGEIEKNWQIASKEYTDLIDSNEATVKEKQDALKKKADLEQELLAAKARIAESVKVQPQIDTSKFQTIEDANKLEAGRAAYFAKVLRVQREHQKLFPDVDLDPEKFLMDALASKKGPEEYWQETYKVGEKREAIAKADKEKHDKEVEDRGYQRALAEMRNPALRTMDSSDEPFYAPKEAKQPWEMGDEELPEAQQLVKELSKTVQ